MKALPQPNKIPLHIVTGFLGTGKTTLLLNLLRQKPETETWLLLVNEFGPLGIDPQQLAHQGAVVKAITGGCLCCARSPVFQAQLAQAIRENRPDRIWIETSGLGHPAELSAQLRDPPWSYRLSIQPVLTLLDANCFVDRRYVEHPAFEQQLKAADALIINHMDTASTEALLALQQQLLDDARPQIKICHGQISLEQLQQLRPAKTATTATVTGQSRLSLQPAGQRLAEPDIQPRWGWQSQQQAGQWSWSCRLRPDPRLSRTAVDRWLTELFNRYDQLWRAKAWLQTDQGWFSIQASRRYCYWQPAAEQSDCRLEFIGAGQLPDADQWQNLGAEIFSYR